VDSHDPFARDREHSERVVLPQVLFGCEREAREVLEAAKVIRMHAGRVEFLAVGGHIGIGVIKRPFEPDGLQRSDLVARGGLDRLQAEWHIGRVNHGGLPGSLQTRHPWGCKSGNDFSLDHSRMTAEFGDHRPFLARHRDVVKTGAGGA